MQWTTLEREDGYCRVSIEAPWSEIEADYQELVAQYGKIRVPGFRPGKVPQGVIEKRFRAEIIKDLSNLAAQRLGRKAVLQAGIEALGPLKAFEIECEKGDRFRFKVRYLSMPDVRLPDLADLRQDDDGTDAIDLISRRLLELVPIEIPDEMVVEELGLDGVGESAPGSEAWTAAADRIRLMMILRKIAGREGIEVDEADVEKRIEAKARDFATTKEALREELEKGGGIKRLRDMLLAESTLEYLAAGK